MFSKAFLAALALTSTPLANALGNAIIKNQCPNDVYVWTCDNVQGPMQTIASGGKYTQGYQINPDGGGISMKLSHSPTTGGPLTQFEYTVDGMLWYDISNINGYPFMSSGLTLTPSDNTCRTVTCPAGVENCSAVYNTPDENAATAACGTDADMTLVLCSDNKDTTPVASPTPAPAAPQVLDSDMVEADDVKVTAAPEPTTAANGAVHTTFVTQIVTVVARDAAPTPEAIAERDGSHAEVHKRAAHRHHFHRHGAMQ